MNRVLARTLSVALVVAFSGLALPGPSFAEEKRQVVTKEEYERLLAAAKSKGCTQVKGCR